MMAYSMPLWTILEKCPAPTLPACTQPNSPSGFSASKIGCRVLTCRGVAAGHQRVAVLQAPHAAGDAAVDEADALLGEQVGVHLVVGPAGVAAVDHDVALVEQLGEGLDRLPGRVAGGTITQTTLGAGAPRPVRRGCRRR